MTTQHTITTADLLLTVKQLRTELDTLRAKVTEAGEMVCTRHKEDRDLVRTILDAAVASESSRKAMNAVEVISKAL